MVKVKRSNCSGLVVVALLVAAVPASSQTARVRVEVSGVEGDVRSNVLNSLKLADVAPDQRLDVERIRQLHEEAAGEIRRALEPFGYYRAKVQSELITAGNPWVARYTIDLGAPLRVNRVEIRLIGEGRDEPQLVEAMSQFPLSQGDVLLQPLYNQGKAALLASAAELGYFDAAFDTSQIRVDLDAYESAIVVQFDTGPRYRFGSVTFNQEVLDSSVVWGYVPFRQGDYFSIAKLIELQNNLNEAPYFARAEVRPMPQEREARRVPVQVELTPQKAARYEVGLGYGTDTGPRATGTAFLRRLNRSGHRARVDARISGIERSLSGHYSVPQVFGRSALLTFSAAFDHFAPVTSKSDRWRTGVSLANDWGAWRRLVGLSLERESFEVGADSGVTTLLLAEGGLSRKRFDDPVFTTHGYRFAFQLKGSQEALASSASFLQLSAGGKYITSPLTRWRLIGRLDAGVTATSQFRQLPPSMRFFAGGDESVRGYAYRSIGERDQQGNVIGGKNLVTASGEIEYRFLEKWGLAGFYDVGDAMSSFDFSSLKQGIGVGLRWISPIGQVRIDGAFPLNDPNSHFRLHLRIGPDL